MGSIQRNKAGDRVARPPGVIDAIADGLSIVLARPLLMTVPLLVDLYLWLGWKVSIDRLTSAVARWLVDQHVRDSDAMVDWLHRTGRSDVTKLLPSLFVPSFLTDASRRDLYTLGKKPSVAPPEWFDAALVVLLLVGALVLAIAYTVPLADAAIERTRPAGRVARAIALGSLRLAGVMALLVGIVLLAASPVLVGSLVLVVLGYDPTGLLVAVFPLVAVGTLLAGWFVPDAVVVSEVGPVGALRNSITVVRRFFWQTLGLIIATYVITEGLGSIFVRIADTAPGLLIGVVGNAFFGTGLAVASMAFYASRIDWLTAGAPVAQRTGRPENRP